jgi:A/G-specific adenine glycosylase
LRWFDANRRDLPWRRTRDPYAIWISEVMLQQTQVSRVVDYWQRFLARFPTAHALAEAALDDVLAAWSGLGYYSRARNLHRAAQLLVAEHDGRLPASSEELSTLPGFGRYTSGAVASIAFGEETPVVDGNVARVLCRLEADGSAPGDAAREARLWKQAGELVQGERPGDLNQALMELGATVCRPSSPSCEVCPWTRDCAAHARGLENQIPPPRARAKRAAMRVSAALCARGGRILLTKRPSRGLFGGLWELPSVEGGDAEPLLELFSPAATGYRPLARVHRTLTHRELSIEVYEVTLSARAKLKGQAAGQWVDRSKLAELGLSSATKKVLEVAQQHSGLRRP